jgi:hypothetical protein
MARIVKGHLKRSSHVGKRKKRAYLRCDRIFLSEGAHNRLCDTCRAVLATAPTPSSEYLQGYL